MQEKTLETKHDLRDKMMKLPFLSGLTAQNKQDLGKFIFDTVYDFAREEGRKEVTKIYWSEEKVLDIQYDIITQYKEELLGKLPKEATSFKDMPNIKGHFYEENEVVAGFNECLSEVKKLLC